MSVTSHLTDERASPAPAAIGVDHISKSFSRPGEAPFAAVEDVTFDVRVGEIVALLGPSGSGKTTILNMVAGLIAPDKGGVSLFGNVGANIDWRRIGYMFQDDRLLPWRDTVTNVALALEASAMGRTERSERARSMLEIVGLGGFERSYPHELSGGMRSRVALARSLVTEPQILLMDEPFGRLDAQTRATMHEQLLDIHHARRLAILMVTHDTEEAVVLSERIVVLSSRPGRIARLVSVDLPRPRSGDLATAAFVNDLRTVVANASSKGNEV